MHDPPDLPLEDAEALDQALDDLQAGHPVDFQDLARRHPALEEPLGALKDLFPVTSPAPPPASITPPETIGRYVIQRELGSGGFGAVYLARDPDIHRLVAVKVLHATWLDQPEIVSRFHREAQACGRLRHPCIVQLFDYSRQGPPFYLVTEYIAGVEPRLWCRERGAPPTEIAELLARTADALEYAHQQGVVHRDLKPGNLLIDAQGQPHILDFGLARLEASEGLTLAERTQDSRILGSLPYMAPEQAKGQSHSADARSDVYALGVILYELLTGRLPIQGPAHSLPQRIVEEAPTPPRQVNPALSEDLEAVCLKALAKRPQDRYATAAAFAADLRAYCAGQPVAAPPRTLLGWVHGILARRHFETLRQGWTLLLLLLGLTILIGCVVCDHWQQTLKGNRIWLAIVITKAVQVAVMLFLAWRLRPADETSTDQAAPMTPAERQIWSLVPGYYGAFLTLVVVNVFLEKPIPVGLVAALLSGMGFWTLGATIWGWFKVWGAAFFLLAVAMVFCEEHALSLLGAGWFVCLAVGSIHLHWTR